MSTFTVVNDDSLVAAIERSRFRLAYIAPGISRPVAEAIGRLFERTQPPAVTVIIDSDPEVCRLGYGTVDGLQALRALLQQHHFGVRHQPGLRVAVLAADDELLVYSPVPQLIEAGSTSAEKPNAIAIGADASRQLLAAAAAEGVDAGLPTRAEIGREAVTPADMDAALRDLEETPPKAYDVARIERVFNAKLQYVELEITGYKLSARKVALPNDLLIGDDPELEKRLRNSFRLFEGGALEVQIDQIDSKTGEPLKNQEGSAKKEPYSEARIEEDRKRLDRDFLTQVPGYGALIRRWDRPAFDTAVQVLRKRLDLYREGVIEVLQDRIGETVQSLARQLLAKMEGQLPRRLGKRLLSASPSNDELVQVLASELAASLGQAEQVFKPELKVSYKDLTYETIQEEKFKEALEAAFKRSGQVGVLERMFEEYDAARESK